MSGTAVEKLRRAQLVLAVLLVYSILSTALHYTHNVVAIDDYPPLPGVPDWISQVVIGAAWPVLTVVGILAYRMHGAGDLWRARAWLLVYSFTGVVTLGHFLFGIPHIPLFWYATIYTDASAGLLLWAYVVWSAVALDPSGRRPTPAELRDA
jgi:hypothetical protein